MEAYIRAALELFDLPPFFVTALLAIQQHEYFISLRVFPAPPRALLTRCHTRPVAAAIGLRGWGCVCHTPMTTAQPLIGPQKISGFYLEFSKNGLRLGVRTAVARHQDRRAPLAQDLWWNLDFSGLAYPYR